jgi:hypothetical protein
MNIVIIFSQKNRIQFIGKFLSLDQWNLIHRLLVNPNTNISMRKKIHTILYTYYDQWSFSKAYQFKQLHKKKCEHISTQELYTYASYGLYKCIPLYKSEYKYPFISFAEKYVRYELLKGLTDLYPITTTSKYQRKKGYTNLKKKINKVQMIGDNQWIYDKLVKEKNIQNEPFLKVLDTDYYNYIWNYVDNMSPFQKRILKLKYNFYFEKIRSNKEVSILMECSEEWIRQNIILIISNLDKNKILCKNKNNNESISIIY